jgi:hypothetical protein
MQADLAKAGVEVGFTSRRLRTKRGCNRELPPCASWCSAPASSRRLSPADDITALPAHRLRRADRPRGSSRHWS